MTPPLRPPPHLDAALVHISGLRSSSDSSSQGLTEDDNLLEEKDTSLSTPGGQQPPSLRLCDPECVLAQELPLSSQFALEAEGSDFEKKAKREKGPSLLLPRSPDAPSQPWGQSQGAGGTAPCEDLLSAQTGASSFLFYPHTSNPRSLPRVIMSLQRLGTKHMTSTACWVAGEERGIVIVEKEASSDHVSTLNQPPPKNQTAQNHPRSWGKPEDQKNKRYVVCVLAGMGVLTSSSSVSIPALL